MFYRIVVRGELTERLAGAFEGMEMEAESGQTFITGQVVDQSHLHGILNRISGLGLPLVSVQALPEYARGEDDAIQDYQNKSSEA
jgi:hypothetical protein